jgi:hypothetical protein
MKMMITIRFRAPDMKLKVDARDSADAEAFFRVLAGYGGRVDWANHLTDPQRKAVRLTDREGYPIALAEVEYLERVRPIRDDPRA